MNVLAVGAHFDDIELGCGGTVARHVRRGDRVLMYVVTHSGYTDPSGREVRPAAVARQEGKAAAAVLGAELRCGEAETNQLQFTDELVCRILRIVEEQRIDTLYTHWQEDVHQDHRAVARASITAGKHVPRLLMYQSNLYDSGRCFDGNYYVDISDTAETKRQAILAHASELGRVGGRWVDIFLHQCEVNGYKVGVSYAEVFAVVKYLGL